MHECLVSQIMAGQHRLGGTLVNNSINQSIIAKAINIKIKTLLDHVRKHIGVIIPSKQGQFYWRLLNLERTNK